ncbi:MAG: hypothetical protein ACQEQV_08355 [Fibrobacterota bacterium]
MKTISRKTALFLFVLLIPLRAAMIPLEAKPELLLRGSVTDEQGYVYDVHILPGYDTPGKIFKRQLIRGGRHQLDGARNIVMGIVDIPRSFRHLHDYITPDPWYNIGDAVTASMRAEKALIGNFMTRDLGATWRRYMQRAHQLRRKRAIGWIFAYPWYSMRATVNSTLRLAGGAVAVPSVFAYATVLRPAWELSRPVLKTGGSMVMGAGRSIVGTGEITWGLAANQAIGALATPLSMNAWNTALGVPTALFSRMPTPETAVNWWVSVESEPRQHFAVDTAALLRDFSSFAKTTKKIRDSLQKRDSIAKPTLQELEQMLSLAYRRYKLLDDSLTTMKDSLQTHAENYRRHTMEKAGFPPAGSSSYSQYSHRKYLQPLLENARGTDSIGEDSCRTEISKLQQSFVRRYGDRYIRVYSPEEIRTETFDPNTVVGDELDSLIHEYR